MELKQASERPDYLAKVNRAGLVYTHEDPAGEPTLYRYWIEKRYYSFTRAEIEVLERAAEAMFEMFDEAGDWLLTEEGAPYLRRFGIPEHAMRAVIDSWNEEPACGSVYGRFDIRYGGANHPDPAMRVPLLLEFNADTPTSLVESTIQWEWLRETENGQDQFNSLEDSLIEAWRRNLALIERKIGRKPVVYFTCSSGDPSHEDEMNTLLLLDACQQAGYRTETLFIENLWIDEHGRYVDPRNGQHIDVIFKLFPWEHMIHEPTSPDLFADMADSGLGDAPYRGGTIWIEPPYKLLWSTKAMLPVLWKLFGDDPERGRYLLPAWFEDEAPLGAPELAGGYARKPLLSREGADISLVLPGGEVVNGEVQGYGSEGHVIQALALLPRFLIAEEARDAHVVLGVWMIDGEPRGMGVRESTGPITDNFSNFVPHSIADGPRTYEPGVSTGPSFAARTAEQTGPSAPPDPPAPVGSPWPGGPEWKPLDARHWPV